MTGSYPRLLVLTFLFMTAINAIRPMVSYRALDLGAGPVELGLITAAYATLSLLSAIVVGRGIDRWGEPWFLIVGTGLMSLTAIWLSTIDSLLILALSQVLLGLGHIVALLAAQTLTANAGSSTNRDARFGGLTVAVSLGQLVGPILAGSLAGTSLLATSRSSTGSTSTVFVASAVMAASAAAVGVSLLRRPVGQGGEKPSVLARVGRGETLMSIARISGMPQAMLVSLTVLSTVDILVAYLPAYGEANGIAVETVGMLLAARAGASMAVRLAIGWLLRWWGRKRVLIWSLLLPAGAVAALPLLTDTWALLVAMTLMGLGLGLGQPLTLAWVASRVPSDARATALGVRLTGNRLGQLVLPAALGVVAGAAGIGAIFFSLAILLAGSAALIRTAEIEPMPEQSG